MITDHHHYFISPHIPIAWPNARPQICFDCDSDEFSILFAYTRNEIHCTFCFSFTYGGNFTNSTTSTVCYWLNWPGAEIEVEPTQRYVNQGEKSKTIKCDIIKTAPLFLSKWRMQSEGMLTDVRWRNETREPDRKNDGIAHNGFQLNPDLGQIRINFDIDLGYWIWYARFVR